MENSQFVTDTTQASFQQDVIERSHQAPVLVDFWAAWCNPCRILMPMLAKLAEEYQGGFYLAKVDTEAERELAAAFGIRSLPTVRMFRYGEVVDEFMGAQPESEVRKFLEKHMPKPEDELLQQALTALKAGDGVTALAILEQAYASDESNKAVTLQLAQLYLALGRFDDAEHCINKLGLNMMDDPHVVEFKAQLAFTRATQNSPSIEQLQKSLAADEKNIEAHYQLGARLASTGNFEPALEHFLIVMTSDRKFQDDAGRKGILAVFDMLGGAGPLVNRYRSKMARLLY